MDQGEIIKKHGVVEKLAEHYDNNDYRDPKNVNVRLLFNTREQEIREILFHYIIETGYETII